MTELLCSVGWVLACVFLLSWLSARALMMAYKDGYNKLLASLGEWERLSSDAMRSAEGWKALYEDATRDRH